MLKMCSHFTLRRCADADKATTATDTLTLEVRRRELELQRAARALAEAKVAVTAVNSKLRSEVEEHLSLAEALQRRQRLQGEREERLDLLQAAQRRVTRAEASQAFLRETMARVQDGLEDFSCPICLRVCRGQAAGAHPAIKPPALCDEEVFSDIAAAPCMHLYCVPCLTLLARSHGACATCRAPLRPDQWTVLGRRPAAAPMPAEGCSAGVHGAKIAAVVATPRT